MIDLTVYDLMGEDHEIEASLNKKTKDVVIKIENENQDLVYSHSSHLYAWEALVYFAKQVLECDRRIQTHLEILEDE